MALLLLFVAELCIGSVALAPSEVVAALAGQGNERTNLIVIDIRLLKTLTALLAGMALSISGLQMQTLFNNPLAGPYVLGLSSGASLGVALLLLGGIGSALGIAGAALAGSFAIMLLLLWLNNRLRDGMTLLILGIMFSSGVSAIVQIMQFISTEQALKSYVVWTMGSLGEVTRSQFAIMAAIVLLGLIPAITTVKGLNLLMLGHATAHSLGLDLRRTRTLLLGSTTLLAGAITAFCGPIGFIGLAIPHIARGLMRTADHRLLLPASALCGACIMMLCDLVSRLLALPINSITALIGIPVVIAILLRKQ